VKLAAIDIGSNAARLLISEVTKQPKQDPVFNKINLVRVPLRLGFDVFETGEISKPKAKMLMQTLKAYKHLLEAYEIKHVYACATSAMRDAKNSKDIIRKVKLETGIEIKVISGQEEASFIYENHVAENLDSDHSYLYIDVGGGSTELTFFANGALVSKESFNIGTIRLLKNQIKEKAWDDMKDYVKKHIKSETTFKDFFKQAKLHKNAKLITGTICGVKIEDIEEPLMKKIRYMDKIVDELAKGRPMEKILRKKD
jgi:exopolyphosphatase/guanosine-5'-triphosphate,3'-diphosphate pyrophosphatase